MDTSKSPSKQAHLYGAIVQWKCPSLSQWGGGTCRFKASLKLRCDCLLLLLVRPSCDQASPLNTGQHVSSSAFHWLDWQGYTSCHHTTSYDRPLFLHPSPFNCIPHSPPAAVTRLCARNDDSTLILPLEPTQWNRSRLCLQRITEPPRSPLNMHWANYMGTTRCDIVGALGHQLGLGELMIRTKCSSSSKMPQLPTNLFFVLVLITWLTPVIQGSVNPAPE